MSYIGVSPVVTQLLGNQQEPGRYDGSEGPRVTGYRLGRRPRRAADRAGAEENRRGLLLGNCCKARNADHRGEVALLSGLAAAVDEYEHAPHGDVTVRRGR